MPVSSSFERFVLRVQLDAPLAVSAGRGAGNDTSSLPHAPATMVRGALAAALRRAGAAPERMDALFGVSGVRTTALIPAIDRADSGANPGDGESGTSRSFVVRPTPLTVRTCKRFGGCLADPTPQGARSAHGAEDTLAATVVYAQDGTTDALDALQTCARCGNVLVPMRGYLRETSDRSYMSQPLLDTRVDTHVGRDRQRRGAAAGVLYTQEVMLEFTEGQRSVLQADVWATAEQAEVFQRHFQERPVIRIGSSISRGLGRCTVTSFASAAPASSLTERLAHAGTWWRQQRGQYGEEATDAAVVTLTLLTPGLFVDAFLRPSTRPQPADLLAIPAVTGAEQEALGALRPLHQVARTHFFQGWNGLSGFPHAAEQGLVAGSVLVFEAPELSEALVSALGKAEQWGIGLRAELGFGRVRVADPIHQALHEHTAAIEEPAAP